MNRNSAGRKTKNCYVIRITSKGRNVFLDPLQCGNLVHVGVAAFHFFRMLFTQRRERKMAETSQSVVNSRKDDILVGERISCRSRTCTASSGKSASVNPNHHRQFRILRGCSRSPNIQEKTIFRNGSRRTRPSSLWAIRTILRCITETLPRHDRLRRSPSEFSHWRCRKRDPFETADIPFCHTPKRSGTGFYNRVLCVAYKSYQD